MEDAGTAGPENEGREPSNMYAQTFARGLAVITAFGEDAGALTISDVAQRTGVTRSTARRLLYTLTTLGYAATDGKNFTLTPRIMELGYAYLSSSAIWRFAEPHIEELVEEVGESASLAVLDGNDVVYVSRIQQRRLLRSPLNVGSRVPAHAVSLGRIQLAMLPERAREKYLATAPLTAFTRWTVTDPDLLRARLTQDGEQGWSMVRKELEDGIAGIAFPIVTSTGRTLAAVNVSLSPDRLDEPGKQVQIIAALERAVRRIGEGLPG